MDNSERRWNERRPAGENRASLLWAEGPDCLETSARLIDISRGGARFVADRTPPAGRDVCLRLETPRKTGWVSVRVVRFSEGMEGGLSFPGYLPHALIDGLV